MALVACPACSKQVSEAAVSCPHCGHPFLTASFTKEPSPAKTDHTFRNIGCGVIVLLLVGLCISSDRDIAEQQTRERLEGSVEGAAIACQTFVKQQLKAPATAKFPNPYTPGTHVMHALPNGVFQISSHVDAQNSFGALIRNTWDCEVRLVAGSYRLTAVVVK